MTESLKTSYDYCEALARRTARNFYFSFLGLPHERFRAMCALYAFMRLSDDLGDDDVLPVSQRVVQLENWRSALSEALDGSTDGHQVFPALADVARRYRIPSEYLFGVVDGVERDLSAGGFETFEELSDYCYHVAGVVGLCCIHVWGFHDERAAEAAVDCGMAFQLTNILRDLAEDARIGRVYLPREDLERFGYTPEDISAHCRDARFRQLMEFEVARTRGYYERAERLFDYLDPVGRPILRAMLRIYGGLLREIERRNYDVFTIPVAVPTWRKVLIAADTVVRQRWHRGLMR